MALRSILACSLINLFTTSACARETLHEEVEYTLDFTPGETLSVITQNGGISLETWDIDQVYCQATKKAKANSEAEAEDLLETTIIEVNEI